VGDHIASKAATVGKLLGMLRRQSAYPSRSARYHVYVSTVRPVMEYGSPVFGNVPRGYLGQLDKLQRRLLAFCRTLHLNWTPWSSVETWRGYVSCFGLWLISHPLLFHSGSGPSLKKHCVQPGLACQRTPWASKFQPQEQISICALSCRITQESGMT